jgi:cell division protein FtsB
MLDDAIRRYGLIILAAAFFAQMMFCEGGVVSYITMRSETKAVTASAKKLEQENIALTKEIDRLQKDDQYLEDVVRKKFGFVREGERVYRVEK